MEAPVIYVDSNAIWLVAFAAGLVAATVNMVVLAALTYRMEALTQREEYDAPSQQNTPVRKARKAKTEVGSGLPAPKRRTSKANRKSEATPVVSVSEIKTRVLSGVAK